MTLLEQLRLDIRLVIKLLNQQRNTEIVDDDITIPEDLPAASMEQIDNIDKWLKESDTNEKSYGELVFQAWKKYLTRHVRCTQCFLMIY